MNKQLEQLKEFHSAVFRKLGDYRSDINQKYLVGNPTASLRADLIEEECNELVYALKNEDIKQVTKELCDVLYVAYGLAVTYNLPVEKAFDLVHQNNLEKLTTGFVGENGKFCKSPTHPKVDLSNLFKEEQLKFQF